MPSVIINRDPTLLDQEFVVESLERYGVFVHSTEKWEYIRNNPVRAGLVADEDAWPYAQRFSRFDGTEL